MSMFIRDRRRARPRKDVRFRPALDMMQPRIAPVAIVPAMIDDETEQQEVIYVDQEMVDIINDLGEQSASTPADV